MCHLENMSKKHWFWAIFANFGPFLAKKGPILNFRPKSETVTFFTVMESQVHEKNQKNLMRGFLRKSGRTDVRTDKRESIGLRDSSRPKRFPIIFRSKYERKFRFWAIIGNFYTTRPPEKGQNLVPWGIMINKKGPILNFRPKSKTVMASWEESEKFD